MIVHSHDYDATFYPAMPVVEFSLQRQAGQPGIVLIGIVDSGADATMVPRRILEDLQARKVRTNWLRGIAGGRFEVDLFAVAIQIGADIARYVEVVASERRDEVIIGRDVLNQFVVSLDAPGSAVSFST